MQWNEVTIHTSQQAVEMISNFLHEAGAGGVVIEDGNITPDTRFGQIIELPASNLQGDQAIVQGYFLEDNDLESLIEILSTRIEHLRTCDVDPGVYRIEVRQINEEDWAHAWKTYFKPTKIGSSIVIKPTWEAYKKEPHEHVIELDPGMAFGTGTHPTTSLCLRIFEEYLNDGETVIDVGTGSGILAIGACKLGAEKVLAIDLDPVAVTSTQENVILNKLEKKITILQSDLLSLTIHEIFPLPVDTVVANILAEVIVLLIPQLQGILKPGGIFVASGIYKNKVELVQEKLKQANFEILKIEKEEEWVAIVAKK